MICSIVNIFKRPIEFKTNSCYSKKRVKKIFDLKAQAVEGERSVEVALTEFDVSLSVIHIFIFLQHNNVTNPSKNYVYLCNQLVALYKKVNHLVNEH